MCIQWCEQDISVLQVRTKLIYSSSHDRKTNLAIRGREPQYESQLRGRVSKMKIQNKQN